MDDLLGGVIGIFAVIACAAAICWLLVDVVQIDPIRKERAWIIERNGNIECVKHPYSRSASCYRIEGAAP